MKSSTWTHAGVVLALWLAGCGQAPEAVVAFSASQRAVTQFDIAQWPTPQTVTVFEPYELRDVTFVGAPAADVLDKAYGRDWRKADVVTLEARDGYRSTIPISRLVQHKAWFAFARTDNKEFVLDKKVPKPERVPIAPIYLVWDSRNDPLIRNEGDYGWPYQLARVQLQRYAEAFPGLAPPEPGTPDIAAGFELFTHHCVTCHSLNGQGGKVGPELNKPHSVTEYWQPEWLHRWLDNPQSVRQGTAMPGMPAQVPDRQKAIDQVIAYLKAMALARP